MATTTTTETARVIRERIEDTFGVNIQSVAAAAGLKPRTFREHLKIGALSLDEVVAVAGVLGVDASELVTEAERRIAARTAA